MSMANSTRVASGVSVVELEGKLAAGGLAPLATVQALLDRGVSQILLNLEGVEFMDSSGLGELVASGKAAGSRGATLKLAGLSANVKRTMDAAGLSRESHIFDDEIDALASFRG
jgi:anti-sigma B factor antagonist